MSKVDSKPIGFELVRLHAERIDDNYEAAAALLAELRVGATATAALLPVIAWAVGVERRTVDRGEQQEFRRARRRGLGFSHDALGARKRALDTMMAFGNGRRVRLGAATVEDHREYIAMLERNVSGLQDTIRFHRELIADIEAAGVSCADEIEIGVTV